LEDSDAFNIMKILVGDAFVVWIGRWDVARTRGNEIVLAINFTFTKGVAINGYVHLTPYGLA
jgi:hypothetical protein